MHRVSYILHRTPTPFVHTTLRLPCDDRPLRHHPTRSKPFTYSRGNSHRSSRRSSDVNNNDNDDDGDDDDDATKTTTTVSSKFDDVRRSVGWCCCSFEGRCWFHSLLRSHSIFFGAVLCLGRGCRRHIGVNALRALVVLANKVSERCDSCGGCQCVSGSMSHVACRRQ